MSHDRKPGRVRVVKAGSASPRRRRDAAGAPAGAANTGKVGGRGQAMLILLFLLASIGTAVAIEVQLPS